jgi:hypothetical protein
VFNTQIGIIFWLATAILYGRERTRAIEAWNAELEYDEDVDQPGALYR